MCNQKENKNNFNLWQQKAFAFLTRTAHQLWGKHDENILAWLFEIGFTNKFAQKNLFGWNKQDKKRSAENWGLSSSKEILLPQGLILPFIQNQKIQKLYTLQTNTTDFDKAYPVDGSLDIPVIFENNNKIISIVTNPEDAFFLKQEVFDITDIAATENKYVISEKITEKYQTIILFGQQNSDFLQTTNNIQIIDLAQGSLIKENLKHKLDLKLIISSQIKN